MTFNISLLSIFSKDTTFGSDVNAFIERSQVLSIIYINVSIFLMILAYDLVTCIAKIPGASFALTFITIPCVFLCFAFLKKGKKETSAFTLIFSMHLLCLFASKIVEIHMAALFSLMVFPTFCSFLTSSNKLHLMNAALCFIGCLYYVNCILKLFEVTLSDIQYNQIQKFIVSAIIITISNFSACYIRKGLEDSLWQMAQSYYVNSKNLMAELVQTVKSREEATDFLFRMMTVPIGVINRTISHLLEGQSDASQVQILKHAKLCGDIILSLINSNFDLAKLKSDLDKYDLLSSDTNLLNTIQRALTLTNEDLKENHNSVKVFIDEDVPSVLWTDGPLLLKLITGQLAEASKYSSKESKIQLAIHWDQESQTKEALLIPEEDYLVKGQQIAQLEEAKTLSPQVTGSSDISSFTDFKRIGEFSSRDTIMPLKNIVRTSTFKRKLPIENSTLSHGETWEIFKVQRPALLASRDRSKGSHEFIAYSHNPKDSPKQKGHLKVQISYTGTGMTPPEIFKLFDSNLQSKSPSDVGGRAAHLGLWICKQMCQRTGGDMRVYSKVTQGTTCVFYIPINMNHRDGITQKTLRTQHERVNALVVDGLASSGELFKLQLERKGVMVTLASTSREALERYKLRDEGYFSFIIIDVNSLETNGFGIVKVIREWEAVQQRSKVDIYLTSDEYDSEHETLTEFRKKTMGTVSTEGVKALIKPVTIDVITQLTERYTRDGEQTRVQNSQASRNIDGQSHRFFGNEETGVRLRKNF